MPSILVVDDDKDSLTVAKSFLENSGYEVHAFDKPELALKHVKDGCTDCKVIVADIKMPEMSGIRLAKLVQELKPSIKVVVMTAYEIKPDELSKNLPTITHQEILQKPFKLLQICTAVKKQLLSSQ